MEWCSRRSKPDFGVLIPFLYLVGVLGCDWLGGGKEKVRERLVVRLVNIRVMQIWSFSLMGTLILRK